MEWNEILYTNYWSQGKVMSKETITELILHDAWSCLVCKKGVVAQDICIIKIFLLRPKKAKDQKPKKDNCFNYTKNTGIISWIKYEMSFSNWTTSIFRGFSLLKWVPWKHKWLYFQIWLIKHSCETSARRMVHK